MYIVLLQVGIIIQEMNLDSSFVWQDKKVACANNACIVTNEEAGEDIQRMEIAQNGEGINIEGIIVLGKIFFIGLDGVYPSKTLRGMDS